METVIKGVDTPHSSLNKVILYFLMIHVDATLKCLMISEALYVYN